MPYNPIEFPEVGMPKKSGPRHGRARVPPGVSASTKRPLPRAPRPTASVPVDSAIWESPPAAEPAPLPRRAPLARPGLGERRLPRPSRANSLPMITDYRYVFADLRRIGILAAAAFLILIGLTFVIH